MVQRMTTAITNGISQSQIGIYRDCPYAYYLKYVKGYQPMMFTTEHLDVGKYIHDAIDIYYKNLYVDNGVIPNDIFKSVYSVLREIWDTTLLPEHLKKAYVCLQNFAIWDFENIQEEGTEPITEENYKYDGFRAKVDYFRESPLKLGDFKSGTYPTVNYMYKIQAAIYLYVLRNKLEIDIDKFTDWFLYPNVSKDVNWKDLQEILQTAKDYRDKITDSFKTMDFPKQPRTKSTCRYCDYRYYCGGIK